MNTNPYMARFGGGAAALIAPDFMPTIAACLQQLAANFDESKAKMAPEILLDDGSDYWPSDPNGWLASIRPYSVQDGILIIPVRGVLLNNFSYQVSSWATGYEYIWQAFARGMDDSNVKGIALWVDSGGGDANGCFDLVDRMFALKGAKPVRSYAADCMCSAAYAVGSVGDSIASTRTAAIGSIGVVTSHLDVSGAMEQAGLKLTYVHAGAHKVDGNAYEPLPADVKGRIQARIDETYKIFVATVARNRGLSEQSIRDTEALVFSPQQAVAKGLADSLGSLDDAVAAFAADLNQQEGEVDMSTSTDTAVDKAAHDLAVTTARAEGVTEGQAAGRVEGASAERARIVAILGSDAGKVRPKAALAAALKTDMTAESANAFLADMAEETAPAPAAASTETLEAAMARSGGGAGVGADAGKKPGDDRPSPMAVAKLARIPGLRFDNAAA